MRVGNFVGNEPAVSARPFGRENEGVVICADETFVNLRQHLLGAADRIWADLGEGISDV